jgi:hypothetical protein
VAILAKAQATWLWRFAIPLRDLRVYQLNSPNRATE